MPTPRTNAPTAGWTFTSTRMAMVGWTSSAMTTTAMGWSTTRTTTPTGTGCSTPAGPGAHQRECADVEDRHQRGVVPHHLLVQRHVTRRGPLDIGFGGEPVQFGIDLGYVQIGDVGVALGMDGVATPYQCTHDGGVGRVVRGPAQGHEVAHHTPPGNHGEVRGEVRRRHGYVEAGPLQRLAGRVGKLLERAAE